MFQAGWASAAVQRKLLLQPVVNRGLQGCSCLPVNFVCMGHVCHDRAELKEGVAEAHIRQQHLHACQEVMATRLHHRSASSPQSAACCPHLGQGNGMQPWLPRVCVDSSLVEGPARGRVASYNKLWVAMPGIEATMQEVAIFWSGVLQNWRSH